MRAEGLSKAFGKTVVLHDFNLELPETGIIGFFGPSGCGKTTLFSLLAGLENPDAGCITNRPKTVSYVFQEDRLLPWCTVLENVRIGAGVTEELAVRVLEQVGLKKALHQYPEELSGGMGRRVAFARALAFSACVLLMDEPFSNIDQGNKEKLYELIKKRKKEQLIGIISHDKDELYKLCDEVIELCGPPLKIMAINKM
jgi:ABC-type nitrate/sulfonate/bicarbonate transport system ATPase subunit